MKKCAKRRLSARDGGEAFMNIDVLDIGMAEGASLPLMRPMAEYII